MLLSIITPTYNRAHCLPDLYKSLLKNEDMSCFEWIIVDDGSIDHTSDIVNDWILRQKINIRYVKKQNEGKTNALFDAFNLCLNGRFSVVIDSDDILVDNAIHFIQQQTLNLNSDEIGLVALKSDLEGNLIGSEFYQEVTSYTEMYFGEKKTFGDKLFIVRTDIYKNSLMRSFKGEKLIPESVFYINMSKNGNFKCLNHVLYRGNYLDDGLSFDVTKLAANNIEGFIFEKQLMQQQKFSFVETIKNEIKYISYSYSGGRSSKQIILKSRNPWLTCILLIPAFIITYKRISVIRGLRRRLSQS
ncbi:glycosyltransferase family A protein [Chryseobacterium oranimense]|uniref:glycosyltransferase family 2 protein n=1 Tax=Chryseobacterium oranimense TaxID=421058 RepID=UPI0031E46DC6